MKVPDAKSATGSVQYLQQAQQLSQPDKARKPTEGKPSNAEDRVELSPEAKDMKKIHDVVAATPEIRTEKVESLAKQVQENRYSVDSRSIADKMTRETLLEMNK
jgi:flagellar biosynthesis anti-sigma factor FlgM